MRPVNDISDKFERVQAYSRGVLNDLLRHFTPCNENITLPATSKLYKNTESQRLFYVLKEGVVTYVRDGRGLLCFEEGDLLGLESLSEQLMADEKGCLTTDFAVIADAYDVDAMFETMAADITLLKKWTSYLVLQSSLLSIVLAELNKGNPMFTPEMMHFTEGQTVVRQGNLGAEVFSLLEGTLDVIVDEVKVGEILADEIFGVIGALTNTPRSATVVAREDCLIISMQKDKFIDLMITRPQTVLKLIEDMARAINSLNHKVVGLVSKHL